MLETTKRKRIPFVVALMSLPLAAVAGQTGNACSLMTSAEAAQILGKPKIATTKPVSFDDLRKGIRLVTVTLARNWGGPPAQLRPTLVKVARTALAKLR